MKLIVEKSGGLSGTVLAPPSKSHTHRAVLIAGLADGESEILNPNLCDDCLATLEACKKLGAKQAEGNVLRITGVDGNPRRPDVEIDVGGSGTTMRLMTAVFALCEGATTLTGNDSVRSRPIAPLLGSLTDLGAKRAKSLNRDGCPPVCVGGRMAGGKTAIDGQSSQFLSALLLACPLADNDSIIEARDINSRPYATMTLRHLERTGVKVWTRDMANFFIPAGQSYRSGDYTVPGDYSSAAFLQAAAIITDSKIQITGLEQEDVQGDKAAGKLMEGIMSGRERKIDLRDTPDLLPILAVIACLADGETTLNNVAHARKKESDRISAMCQELGKMGATIEELPDGLKIHGTVLKGAELDGHGDHRIVMALAVAGLGAEGRTIINGANTVSKSYPGFVRDLASLGAEMRTVDG